MPMLRPSSLRARDICQPFRLKELHRPPLRAAPAGGRTGKRSWWGVGRRPANRDKRNKRAPKRWPRHPAATSLEVLCCCRLPSRRIFDQELTTCRWLVHEPMAIRRQIVDVSPTHRRLLVGCSPDPCRLRLGDMSTNVEERR